MENPTTLVKVEDSKMEPSKMEPSKMENLKRESIRKQLIIMACVSISPLIVGWNVGWTAPIIPKLQDLETSPLDVLVTDLQVSWIGSLLYIGSAVGPYITCILSNMIGRKPCLIIGECMNLIAYILVITTNNIGMIYAVRVINGLGMGITVVCNIVYVGEIASTHIRGILLTISTIMAISGTLLVYIIGAFVSYAGTGYVALGICLLNLLGIIFVVPESPVYYALKDNDVKATKTLNMLGRSADVENVINTYAKKKGETASKLKDWTEIFTIKSNRWSFFLIFMLASFQQLSGASVVLFFATSIFQLAQSSIRPDVATIIIGSTGLLASFVAPTLIESKGRRILLLFSMAACAVSLAVLGAYFYLDRIDSPSLPSIGWLPLVTLIVYVLSFEIGFGTIPGVIVGEMFRANVRSNGSTVSITMSWLVGFGVTSSFTSMINGLGPDVTFWIFGGSCIVAFIFTFFCLPETKGKTLHEIQEMLS